MEGKTWSELEFRNLSFGDGRLNKRFVKTLEDLYRQPLSPINKACGGWAETKAAYRLFANDKFSISSVMDCHRENSVSRMQEHDVVLAVQDTTLLNFDAHSSKEGLGSIGSNKSKGKSLGLVMHNTLAVSPEGLPLGLLDQQIYARHRDSKVNPGIPIRFGFST